MNLLFEDMSSQVETKSDEGRTKIFASTFSLLTSLRPGRRTSGYG